MSGWRWYRAIGGVGLLSVNGTAGLVERRSSRSFVASRGNGHPDCTSLVGYFSTERDAMDALLESYGIAPGMAVDERDAMKEQR
jgi:hypothetical protein